MSLRTNKNVGLIGLGTIGRRVADHLRKRGFNVFVWNRTPRPVQNFVGSPAEVAQLCDYVQIFVSDDSALLETVQQLSSALTARHILLAHSTVAPETIRSAAEIVQRRGARLLEAPFTGSKAAAENGQLVYYIGGDDAALREARPVLEASSKGIMEIGGVGDAAIIKLATNMITAAVVQSGAEALALVHKAGLPADKLLQALRGNASSSTTLEMKLPKMIGADYEPHFAVKHMLKDVRIAGRLAQSFGLHLGATEAAHDALLEQVKRGRGDEDYSAIGHKYFSGPIAPVAAETPAVRPRDDRPPAPVAEEHVRLAARNGGQTPDGEVATGFRQPASATAETLHPTVETEEEPEPHTAMAVEPASPAAATEALPAAANEPAPRGFLSRLFGRLADY